ncbi:MAG: TonB family protein [Alphaproteobacteria bacterium]|nr:TonB family protein [Alphaproteobacteria bacterium]
MTTWRNIQPNPRSMTLMPTHHSLGNNTYLSGIDFNKMLMLALVIHVLVLGLTNLLPEEKVTTIPVHSLSFKIGENQAIRAFQPAPVPQPKFVPEVKPEPVKQVPAPKPVAKAPAKLPTWKPATTEKSVIKTNAPKAEVPSVGSKPLAAPTVTPPVPRQVPQENQFAAAQQKIAPPAPKKEESSLLDFLMLPINAITADSKKPAIADSPQQYVRDHGAAPSQEIDTLRAQARNTFAKSDTASAVGEQTSGMSAEQQVRANYEKVISAWIGQHKIYPASARGREGRAVLRIRIDRQGYVRYYALEESSGVAVLNSAAIDMIRRANPVPAVPENYPAGNLIEFLIPITFEAP